MTEFEQQVADALARQLKAADVPGRAREMQAYLADGIAQQLAPRVAAAIEAFREVVEYAAEQRGDLDDGLQAWERERERALAALRGEA